MIPRRTFAGVGAVGLMSCAPSRGDYFGSTVPPASPKLVYSLAGEPDTLDPAKSVGGLEFWVIPALFEGLTQYHPQLPQPMAALATHYEASAENDQFTFYLRGHPKPRGVQLPNSDSLPAEFTGGRKSAPGAIPARWSDGRPITANDFVYSWRRLLSPETAATMAYQLHCIDHAEDINTGKRSPDTLGVRALDDFTFQVDLRSPTPVFLQLITQYLTHPVPRQAVEAARRRGEESSWTEPQHIVGSGPFLLREWRRGEVLRTVKNPWYYDAGIVGIEELIFLPVAGGNTAVNLYRSGSIAATLGSTVHPLLRKALAGKKDFHVEPAFATLCLALSTRKPPFDNVLLRYSLAMGTEKKAIADVLGISPASRLVPAMPGYPVANKLLVRIDGHAFDIQAFDVQAARALLAKSGLDAQTARGRGLDLTYHFPIFPGTKPRAEILQQHWRRDLGVRANLLFRENNVHWKMLLEGDFTGIADFPIMPTYFDPYPFLDPFVLPGVGNPTGWTDTSYTSMLADANRARNPQERMAKLFECERRLMSAMPILPLYVDVWTHLQKPFVRGLTSNLFDVRAFKYARIDPDWSPTC